MKSGGIIYGAAYNDQGIVKHIGIENREELQKLRGAKYSQSILGDCFQLLKRQLISGRKVLFSGTSCQVAGLKAYLQKDYNNLICVDFVCHGVPSPMVWEKYLKYRAKIDNNGVLPQHINMRNKESGWSKYSYSIDFSYTDNRRYLSQNGNDPFMILFVNDYILRESCSNCRFKGYSRDSDITLGDFWGIWNIDSDMDDNGGTSLVLVNSAKGENMLAEISENIKCKKFTLEQAVRENPSLIKSVVHKADRDHILKMIECGNFSAVLSLIQGNQSKKSFSKRIIEIVFKKLQKL